MELLPYLVTRVIDFSMRVLFSELDYKIKEETTPSAIIWRITLFNGDSASVELLPTHVIATSFYSERIWDDITKDFIACVQAIAKQLDLLSTVECPLIPLSETILADFVNIGIDYPDHRDEIVFRYGMYSVVRFKENQAPTTFEIQFDDVVELLHLADTERNATIDFDSTCRLIPYVCPDLYEEE